MKFGIQRPDTGRKVESVLFKQVPGGYVFRAPNPRVFGDSDHYLVNATQRDDILASLTAGRPRLLVALWLGGFVLAAVALLVVFPGYPVSVTIAVIVAMLLAAILGLRLSATRKLRRLQPILAGAARTDQRITLAEISRTMRDQSSYPQLRLVAILNTVACVLMTGAAVVLFSLRKPHVDILSEPLPLLLCFSAITCAVAAATSIRRAYQKAKHPDGPIADPLPDATSRRLAAAWPFVGLAVLAAIAWIAVRGEFSDDRQGLRYAANGQHDAAIASFSNAIAAAPGNPAPYLHRASSYEAKGDHARAIADYSKAIEIEPGDAAVHRNRGNVYRQNGDPDRAIADYDASIALEPDNAYSYYSRGLSYDAKKDGDRAIADYTKAITLRPQDPYWYSARARDFEAKGDQDRAIADFGKATEINPKDSYSYSSRARIFEARGDRVRADADFDKSIAADPSNYFAYYFRGFALKARGDHDRAIADLSKAIDINPGIASGYVSRAQSFDAKGEHDPAIADYKKVLDLPAASESERRTQDFARQRIAKLEATPPAPPKQP